MNAFDVLQQKKQEAMAGGCAQQIASQLVKGKLTARRFVDEVIKPEEARMKLIKGFKMLENKIVSMPARKHRNIPV